VYYQQIEVGMCLRLKRNRMNDYNLDSPYVRVTAINAHSGYKVPWIMSGKDAFRPSDFERQVNDPRNDLAPKSQTQTEEI
jgi:hypothetical protein